MTNSLHDKTQLFSFQTHLSYATCVPISSITFLHTGPVLCFTVILSH